MSCRQRQHRRNWKEQQDMILKQIVGDRNIKKMKWNQVADQLSQRLDLQLPRTSKQCRQRWMNIKTNQIQTDNPWTVEQDLKLIRACKQYGHRWAKLAIQIGQGRNDNSLKNHFYSTLRRAIRWITRFLKVQKKNYLQSKKTEKIITNQDIYEQFCKIRNFQSKNLTKVFSMIDSKQQSRFQSTKDFQYRELQELNHQILQFMEQFVQQKVQQIQKYKIILMIVKICRINRDIKTKYIKEVKLSILQMQQIQKKRQEKKKLQKKQQKLVKNYMKQTNTQIIPSKNKKQEILSEIELKNVEKIKKKRQIYTKINLQQIPEKSKSSDSKKNSLNLSQPKSKQKINSFKQVFNHRLQKSNQYHIDEKSEDHNSFHSNFLMNMNMLQFRNKPPNYNVQQIQNNNPFKFSYVNPGVFQFPVIDRSKLIQPQNIKSNPSYNSLQNPYQNQQYQQSGLFSNNQKTAENKIKLNLSSNFISDINNNNNNNNNHNNVYRSQNYANVHWTPQQNNFAIPLNFVGVPSPCHNIQPNPNMYISRPLSNSLHYQQPPQYNMFDSQPVILQRSLNYRQSNLGSSNAMYHSFSYASSQQNKSATSKKGAII